MKFCVFLRSLPFLDSMATPAWAKKHAVTLATAPHKLPVFSKLCDGRFQTVSFSFVSCIDDPACSFHVVHQTFLNRIRTQIDLGQLYSCPSSLGHLTTSFMALLLVVACHPSLQLSFPKKNWNPDLQEQSGRLHLVMVIHLSVYLFPTPHFLEL